MTPRQIATKMVKLKHHEEGFWTLALANRTDDATRYAVVDFDDDEADDAKQFARLFRCVIVDAVNESRRASRGRSAGARRRAARA